MFGYKRYITNISFIYDGTLNRTAKPVNGTEDGRMRPFLDEDFLLDTQTARALYHGVAEGMPILDYHCHVSPREIAEDRVFRNLTQLWL